MPRGRHCNPTAAVVGFFFDTLFFGPKPEPKRPPGGLTPPIAEKLP